MGFADKNCEKAKELVYNPLLFEKEQNKRNINNQ